MTGPPTAEPSPVLVRHEQRTAVVELARPPANMIDETLALRLRSCLEELDASSDTDAIVLTGAGEVFCGGADAAAVRSSGRAEEFAEAITGLFAFFPASTTPLLAAVNGDALAGGFGLVCSCDIVIVADGARLGTNEAKLGGWPALAMLPALRRVPEKAAIRNVLTGEPFTTPEALALGIVDEVVAPADLLARTRQWADAVTVSGRAVATGRPQFYRARQQTYPQALAEARGALARAFSPSQP